MATLLSVMLCVKNANAQDAINGKTLSIDFDASHYPNQVKENSGSASIGKGNRIESNMSIAIGSTNFLDTATTACAAIGDHNTLSATHALAFGYDNVISCGGGLTIGRYLYSGGSSTNYVIGQGISAQNPLGNNADFCLLVGFNSTKPTLFVGTSNNSNGIIDHTGSVAIGDVPYAELSAKLHIRSDEGEDAGIILEPKQPEANGTFIRLHDGNHGISVGTNGEMCINSGAENNKLPLTLNGHVGINTTNDLTNYQYALTVDGGILTDRVLIKSVDEWYDAVFTDNYRLMPLNELKDFVATHHHLPEVPSENEVMEEGYDMGEMQGLLLKKIEELTLYTIQLQEQIERQQKELELQQKEIEELKAK